MIAARSFSFTLSVPPIRRQSHTRSHLIVSTVFWLFRDFRFSTVSERTVYVIHRPFLVLGKSVSTCQSRLVTRVTKTNLTGAYAVGLETGSRSVRVNGLTEAFRKTDGNDKRDLQLVEGICRKEVWNRIVCARANEYETKKYKRIFRRDFPNSRDNCKGRRLRACLGVTGSGLLNPKFQRPRLVRIHN